MGMGLFRIHPPQAYSKKSSQGSTDESTEDRRELAKLTQSEVKHRFGGNEEEEEEELSVEGDGERRRW